MELKEIDKKILTRIFQNRNPPVSKIARELKLSRDKVDYRIKKYISEGLIRKFFTFFDYSSFGYNYLVALFLKFEKTSHVEKFTSKLKNHKNVISYGKCLSKYDLYMNAVFRNEDELSKFISELFSSEETTLSDYLVLKPYFQEFYSMKFIDSKETDRTVFAISKINSEKEFDDKDIKIMKMLNENAWEPIVNIANKLGSSSENIIYRIKRLEKEEVILGTRIQFNLSNMGYFATLFLVDIPNLSETNKTKLKKFVKEHPGVNLFILSFSRPNCAIQIFHKSEEEMRKTINKLKEVFKTENLSIEVLPLEEEKVDINTLPFL